MQGAHDKVWDCWGSKGALREPRDDKCRHGCCLQGWEDKREDLPEPGLGGAGAQTPEVLVVLTGAWRLDQKCPEESAGEPRATAGAATAGTGKTRRGVPPAALPLSNLL